MQLTSKQALAIWQRALIPYVRAHSPDLSPIEKAWAVTERLLWAEYTWTDLASFQVALEAAWAAAVTPAYCSKLFAGINNTYAVCAANGGRPIRGWGASARPSRARKLAGWVDDDSSDGGQSDGV